MFELKDGFANTNGIKMHYVEQGSGPLVVLCHGWPESWYSWRHQLLALAAAGFRVVAPDQRGFGQTDQPEAIETYNILNLVGDIVGLVNALGEESAVVVGHDWGARVAWNCALMRNDLFRGLGLLSDPYVPRGPVRPTVVFEQITKDKNFYQAYFQEPGKVERELEEDVHRTMLGVLYGGSGDASAEQRFKFLFDKNQRFVDTFVLQEKLPPWLTQQDLNFFTSQFKQSGFRGGVNWYRNIDRNWELTPFLDGAKIIQPTVFAAGDRDIVMEMSSDGYKMLETNAPNLHKKYLIPGAGHWIQQERPTEISQLLIEFLTEL
jgi:pimeloyl-ACP methyl ester carboxylesterase